MRPSVTCWERRGHRTRTGSAMSTTSNEREHVRNHDKRLDKKLRKAADEVIKTQKEAQRILKRTERRKRREKRGGDQYGWQAEPRNQEGPAVEGEQARPEEEGQVTC